MPSPSILQALLSERILVLDGAMGTQLQRLCLGEEDFRGVRFRSHSRVLLGDYDVLSLTRPDLVTRIHVDYLEAGSDIIQTNTFSSTAVAQADYGLTSMVYELNLAAGRLARSACDAWTARTPRRPRFAAGTIGPTNRSVSKATARDVTAFRGIAFDQLKSAYKDQVRGLDRRRLRSSCGRNRLRRTERQGGVCRDRRGVPRNQAAPLPVMVSATVSDPDGRTLAGQTIEDFWTAVAPCRPFSVGLNCSSGAARDAPSSRNARAASPSASSAVIPARASRTRWASTRTNPPISPTPFATSP